MLYNHWYRGRPPRDAFRSHFDFEGRLCGWAEPQGKPTKWVKVSQSCLTLCNPKDYTIHGILQARILDWVAFPFSRASSQPRNRAQVSHIASRFFTSWATREACFWTVVLEKTLESPLNFKEIQPVLPKGDQSWVFIGRTDVEAETPILWPPDAKSCLIAKDPDSGKDWGQEEKGTTEHEMVGWHHQLKWHGFK